MSLFLCLPHISLGQYCQKNVVKGGGFGKKIYKIGDGHMGRLSIEGEVQTFCILRYYTDFNMKLAKRTFNKRVILKQFVQLLPSMLHKQNINQFQ